MGGMLRWRGYNFSPTRLKSHSDLTRLDVTGLLVNTHDCTISGPEERHLLNLAYMVSVLIENVSIYYVLEMYT